MQFTKILFSLFLFIYLSSSQKLENKKSPDLQNNIAFDLPDLTAIYSLPDEQISVQLEAFRSRLNDKILAENDTSKYSQLMWVSTGNPRLVKSKIVESSDEELFYFTNEGFYTYIEMLNEDHIDLLAEKAKQFYKIDISHKQIINLILSKFECTINLYSHYSKTLIKGKVSRFRVFPLRVDFLAPIGTKERELFTERISDTDANIAIECEMASQGIELKVNTLTITARQFNQLNLVDKIFGPANESYVTREQASALSAEFYSSLNIVEEYQMSESEFKESFVKDFIKFASAANFKPISLTKAIDALSSYSIDFSDDLIPNIIKQESSKLFKIEKFKNKSHIVVNDKGLQSLKESGRVRGGSGGSLSFMGIFSIGASVKKASETSSEWYQSSKSLSDQLNELNKESEDAQSAFL